MADETPLGMNRTGIDMAPIQSKEMINITEQARPSTLEDAATISSMRGETFRQAETLGSVPVPGTLTGAGSTAIGKVTGKNPEVLIDKLAERLAFERTGVRLYAAFIAKCQAAPADAFNVPVDQALRFCEQEREHFKLLAESLRSIGADPTAQTPSADAMAVSSQGVMQVLTDPRTTIAQCLEAVLTLELTDNAAWEVLIKLAEEMGYGAMAGDFRYALQEEEEHLKHIRRWHQQAVLQDAGVQAAV
jgi:bacterioferritin (cytochrome b1)